MDLTRRRRPLHDFEMQRGPRSRRAIPGAAAAAHVVVVGGASGDVYGGRHEERGGGGLTRVLAAVGDFEDGGVAVEPLHLLLRFATVEALVCATVIAPAKLYIFKLLLLLF